MPTKFRIELQDPLRSNISGQTAAVRSKRESKEWCTYPQFVENLGKEMNTPAEELHHHTTGMSGEAGELLDATKKVWIYGKPVDVEHIIEEMGDLRWYYQSMLNMIGLTDEDIQAANTVKLMKRYPEGVYSNEQAIARADKVAQPEPRKFFGMPTPPVAPQKPAEEGLETAIDTHNDKIRALLDKERREEVSARIERFRNESPDQQTDRLVEGSK